MLLLRALARVSTTRTPRTTTFTIDGASNRPVARVWVITCTPIDCAYCCMTSSKVVRRATSAVSSASPGCDR